MCLSVCLSVTDVDECSSVPDVTSLCGPHSQCVSVPGNYLCQCNEGFNRSAGLNCHGTYTPHTHTHTHTQTDLTDTQRPHCHVLLFFKILFAVTSVKQIAIQQSITWSNMLSRTEMHISALTSALNEVEIRVKPNRQYIHKRAEVHCVSKKTRHQTLAHNFPKC